MDIEEKHKKLIKKSLKEVNNRTQLINLLNDIMKLRFGPNLKKKITEKQINYYLARLQGKPLIGSNSVDKLVYNTFEIRKKTGGTRIINAPEGDLKLILTIIDDLIRIVHTPHSNSFGFVTGKSIVDNANLHQGKNYVYNIDLKNFFHSFDLNRVKMAFWNYPFELNGKEREPLAFMLASLATFTIDGNRVLPQGSPCSPALTNVLCYRLDRRLTGLAKKFGLTYSRYADDITFSSDHYSYNNNFKNELQRIIKEENLEINKKKVRLQTRNQRQEVTGLTVNETTNVNKRFIKQIRMYLHYCESYGVNIAKEIFLKDFIDNNTDEIKIKPPSIESYLRGKLNYLSMVKGKNNSTYLKLETRFNKLFEKKTTIIGQIIDLWKEKGIDAARDKYYNSLKQKTDKEIEEIQIVYPYDFTPQDFDIINQTDNTVIIEKEGKDSLYQSYKRIFANDMSKDVFKDLFGWQYSSEEAIINAFEKYTNTQQKKLYETTIELDNVKKFIQGFKPEMEKDIIDFIINYLAKRETAEIKEWSRLELEKHFKIFQKQSN